MGRATVLAIDAMGGDNGPAPLMAALDGVLRRHGHLRCLVFGDSATLQPLIRRRERLAGRCDIRHCTEIVRMDDLPARAIRERRASSMWRALEAVRSGEAGAVLSAGNTGALLAMSVLLLKRAPGVARPAIAVHWPADRARMFNTVLDVGADFRADPAHLAQFAVMGAEYARLSFGLDCPRVGILNLGTEEMKGPPALREAARLTAEAAARSGRFAFEGFAEGTDLSGSRLDVIVTDGFTGNVALKTAEGTAGFVRAALIKAFKFSWLTRFASMFAITTLMRLRRRIDPRRVNGGVFLGLGGAVVKSHGAADQVGFASAIELAIRMAESDFTERVASQLVKLDIHETGGPQEGHTGA